MPATTVLIATIIVTYIRVINRGPFRSNVRAKRRIQNVAQISQERRLPFRETFFVIQFRLIGRFARE